MGEGPHRGRTPLANMAWKGLSLATEKGLRFLVALLAMRALGDAPFGRFQFAFTVTTMLALGTDLGLGIWTTRALARDRARAASVVATTLRMRALMVAPYALVTAVIACAVGPGDARWAMAFLGVSALTGAFVDHFGAVLRGYERLDDEGRMNIGTAVLVSGAALGGLVVGRSVAALSAGIMAGTLAGAAYGLSILRRHYRLPVMGGRALVDRALARTARAEALPLWLASLLSMLYFRGDVVLLRLFTSYAELGAYSAAYKFFEGAMYLPAVLLAALFPPLARAHGDRDRQGSLERRVLAALAASGIAVASVLYFGREAIIRLGPGEAFGRAVPSLRILALGLPLIYCNFGLTHFLIARNLGRRNLALNALMLVVNVGVNLFAIPRWGGPGAAVATVVTEAALTVGCLLALGWRPAHAIRRSRAPRAARTAHTSG